LRRNQARSTVSATGGVGRKPPLVRWL
jgi:hypothetical protein